MQGIEIDVSDFKRLRVRDNYFIDKSLYIKDIIDNQSSVILVTRPRKFGKTLNMSMLKYYFDCNGKDNKELFKGLKIMEQDEKYTSKLGYYPCIYFTLKDVAGNNYEEMIASIKKEMSKLFNNYKELLNSEKLANIEKTMFKRILGLQSNEVEVKNGIKLLSELLYKTYDRYVIILLDAYDEPFQNMTVYNYYEEARDFFKRFLGITFKDNKYLEKAIITGISNMPKDSVFSGANNVIPCTVLNKEFSDDFGITTEEMNKVIKDFEVEEDREEIKKWYDGYTIGNTTGIYNPWSILNYLTDRKLIPYWVNTSSNDLIKLILKNSTTVKEKIERLLKDETIEATVDQETVIMGIEQNEDNIWGLLVGTGYLKIVEAIDITESSYKVKIPNYEIKALFQNIIRDWFKDKVIGNDLNSILKDLITLNLEEFEEKFKILVTQMFSFMDVGVNTAENFYHAFVLGMLVGLKDSYYVNSNRESGLGRYDIMLEPKDKNGNSFIMEFKVLEDKEEKTIEETIENAKKQIEEKRYEESLKEREFINITKMVFAFKGKEVKMEVF